MLKKISVLILALAIASTLFGCGKNEANENNDVKEGATLETSIETVEEEENNKAQEEEKKNERKRSELLPNTYNIPLFEFYVDTPDFNDISSGYTEIFRDGSTKYVAVTDFQDDTLNDEKETFDVLYPRFKNALKSYSRINSEIINSTEIVEINGITAQRFSGVVKYGTLEETDLYIYGYSFIFEGIPCLINGVVTDKSQPQEEIDSLTAIVDAMMESVRNTP